MAWYFALWAQGTPAEADALRAYFDGAQMTLADGTVSTCVVAPAGEGCCWVRPAHVSEHGARNGVEAERLTEVGHGLYTLLRTAPPFELALVGIEVDDVRAGDELDAIIRSGHPAYLGLVVTEARWRGAGAPSGYVPFRLGYVWRPYAGEASKG